MKKERKNVKKRRRDLVAKLVNEEGYHIEAAKDLARTLIK